MFAAAFRHLLSALSTRPTSRPVRRLARCLEFDTLDARITPATLSVGTSALPTIQSAINAATNGDTILVPPGTYTEQLLIGANLNHLTLTTADGTPDVTIQAPDTLTGFQAIIEVSFSSHVTINDFNLVGNSNTQYGIRVDNHASATITANSITNILGSNGAGIDVGDQSVGNQGTGQAVIIGNSISAYTKVGIVVDNTATHAAIACNTITGLGDNAVVSQYGIQISRGAQAVVLSNVTTQNTKVFAGPIDSAGIFTYGINGNTEIQGNSVHNNDIGIFIQLSNNVDIESNQSFSNNNDGIQLLDSSNNQVCYNVSAYNGGDGISIYGDPGASANNNILDNNIIYDNQGNGVTIDNSDNDIVKYNVIADNGGDGIQIDPLNDGNSNNLKISFNLIDQDNGNAAIGVVTTDANNHIVNNVILS
jgi:parallel beta-helix repeat protein